ncbi:tetratricopeptide repeat protein [Streptomyces sp. XY152]|uniref:tetratricopeptide repeat protein n=1 Tax=Streptomyces sp. XY152 TaxID=1415560 RepID=UPI001F187C90|nr:tetratricopeptide repeat protein [Streptomyces sp. XY152]
MLLRRLQAAHLVQEHAPSRYRMHDLIRLYAAERAREDPTDESDEALSRLVDFHLRTAHTAAGRSDPHRDQIHLAAARQGVVPQELTDSGAALAWFTAEHPVLLGTVDTAVTARLDAQVWQLAQALETFFDHRGHWHDWAANQHTALKAAQRLGDRSWQAGAHRSLGSVYTQMGRLDDGHTHFRRAPDLYGHLDDRINQAHTHRGLGWVRDRQGRRRDALDHNERALALYRQTGHRTGQAKALNNAGWLHIMLGDYRQALDYSAQAVAVNQETGDRHGEAGAWDSLGDTHLAAGDPDAARSAWRQALKIADEIGPPPPVNSATSSASSPPTREPAADAPATDPCRAGGTCSGVCVFCIFPIFSTTSVMSARKYPTRRNHRRIHACSSTSKPWVPVWWRSWPPR